MAYANIPNVTLANTFDHWRNDTNSLIDLANLIVKGDFHKETGDFFLDNGTLHVSRSNGTGIAVSSDITVANTIWANNIVVSNDQIINGQWLLTSESVILRSTLPSNGNGSIVVQQGGSNGNAVIQFDSGHNIWQLTSNSSNTSLWSTILTKSNVSDSVNSTSSINVASSLAVNTAYHAAQTAWSLAANADQTATVTANGTSAMTAVKLNFVNSPTISVSVGAGSLGNANISFAVVGGSAQGIQGTRGNSVQGTSGTSVQGTRGIQGADGGGGGGGGSQGVQGTLGATGPQGTSGGGGGGGGAPNLRHVSGGYTSGGEVFVATATPTANNVGDVWFDLNATAGFSGTLAASGWTKLPNGMKMAWGTVTCSLTGGASFSYASGVAFTTVYNIQLTAVNSANSAAGNYDFWAQLVSFNSSTFNAMLQGDSSTGTPSTATVHYLAIGV
jgi:hypothetical protein